MDKAEDTKHEKTNKGIDLFGLILRGRGLA